MKIKFFLSLLITVLLFSKTVNAQNKNKLDDLKAQHTAFITSQLNLSPSESEKFWPIYNEYTEKTRQIKKEDRAKQQENLSESDAAKMITLDLANEQKLLDLKKQYYTEFQKVIPSSKLAKLDKVEQKFKRHLIERIGEKKMNQKGTK